MLQHIPVAGSQYADIDWNRPRTAHPLDLALLQRPQQLGLQGQRQLRHLIEQQGATVGLFELSGVRGSCPGKRTFFVTEQGALQQVIWDCRAIDGDKWAARPLRCGVDEPRQHLLADAALAVDQHRGVRCRHPLRERIEVTQAGALQTGIGIACIALEAGDLAQQDVEVERFGQVMAGAFTHGLHGPADVAVSGHHDHRHLRPLAFDLAKQRVAIHWRHLDISEHQTHTAIAQNGQGSGTVGRFKHRITRRTQHSHQRAA